MDGVLTTTHGKTQEKGMHVLRERQSPEQLPGKDGGEKMDGTAGSNMTRRNGTTRLGRLQEILAMEVKAVELAKRKSSKEGKIR
eukprot:7963555-Karenia_brevis.AAC.1